MFRKNYLPSLTIYKTHDNKWIAVNRGPGSRWLDESLAMSEDGNPIISPLEEPTQFDTVDEIIKILYVMAFEKHLIKIKQQITYSGVSVKL